jgi:hypothetical protein
MWFVYGGIAAYVVVAIVFGIVLHNHEMARPIIGAIFWPLMAIKLLLGGG